MQIVWETEYVMAVGLWMFCKFNVRRKFKENSGTFISERSEISLDRYGDMHIDPVLCNHDTMTFNNNDNTNLFVLFCNI